MRSSLFSTAVATALLAASSSQIALAQIVAPGTGQQIAPSRDELQDRTRQQPAAPSRLKIEGDIERAPGALDSPAYANLNLLSGSFPVAERLAQEALSLPMFPELTAQQLVTVVKELRSAVRSMPVLEAATA